MRFAVSFSFSFSSSSSSSSGGSDGVHILLIQALSARHSIRRRTIPSRPVHFSVVVVLALLFSWPSSFTQKQIFSLDTPRLGTLHIRLEASEKVPVCVCVSCHTSLMCECRKVCVLQTWKPVKNGKCTHKLRCFDSSRLPSKLIRPNCHRTFSTNSFRTWFFFVPSCVVIYKISVFSMWARCMLPSFISSCCAAHRDAPALLRGWLQLKRRMKHMGLYIMNAVLVNAECTEFAILEW